jgi:hypothetical protein
MYPALFNLAFILGFSRLSFYFKGIISKVDSDVAFINRSL